MLQAKTKEQKEHILFLAKKESCDGVVTVYDDEISYKVDSCFDVDISFDTMAKIVDYLRTYDKKEDMFEKCWIAYRRKGSKKKSLEYWKKLTNKEKEMVFNHVVAYVESRELRYQKDFERYLRDKTFLTVVFRGNNIVFDPMVGETNEYRPAVDGAIKWNETKKCYIYIGMFFGYIPDGYKDDERPNGACIMLNNGGGMLTWDSETKRWEKK